MGIMVGVGFVVVVGIVVALVMMRNKGAGGSGADAVPPAPPLPPAPAGPATVAPAPPKPRQAATLSMLPQVAAAPPTATGPELKMVSCEVDGKLHGAMPPFGRLLAEDATIAFEASSRVVALSGNLASGDGVSTMQSVGNIEMGKFRYEFNVTAVSASEFEGAQKAIIEADGRRYVFEGLGPSAKLLHDWLRGHGLQG